MSNLPDTPNNAMAALFSAIGGVSYEELTAQADVAQKASEPTYVRPDAGKIVVRYAKTGKFEIPDPKTMNKPEDERVTMTPKRIKGVIVNSAVWLQNWPMGSRGPACKSISYKSQALDPETHARKVIEGSPALPAANKWDFIRRYEPAAQRNERSTDVDGNESVSRTKTSCLSCMEKSEASGDGFFKGCQFRGSLDFVLTHVGDTAVEQPMLCYIEMSATSVGAFAQLTGGLRTRFGVNIPAELHIELGIEAMEAKDGSPYYKLKFTPCGHLKDMGDDIMETITTLYQQRNAALSGGAAAKALPESKPEPKKVKAAAGPNPF